MKILILLVLYTFTLAVQAQSKQTQPPSELTKLRAEFIRATEDYKLSLAKLLVIYEGNVQRAEDRLKLSEQLLSEGQISIARAEESKRALAQAHETVAETKRQLENADKQIAAIFDEAKFAQEYKKAKVARKRARHRPCLNWDVVMSQRQTAYSLSFSYKIVCR